MSIASQLDTYDLMTASAWEKEAEGPEKGKFTELESSVIRTRETWEEMAPGVAVMTGAGASHIIHGPEGGPCEYQAQKMTSATEMTALGKISQPRSYHARRFVSLSKAFWMR